MTAAAALIRQFHLLILCTFKVLIYKESDINENDLDSDKDEKKHKDDEKKEKPEQVKLEGEESVKET